MTKYREILRLKALNLSQQSIADSCSVSKKTVNRVLKRAEELGISWPLDENDTDAVLAEKFFPSAKPVQSSKRLPDFDYIRKELLRNGVSKKLLWTEYMEDCRANGDDPLMYSQFCYHIQRDEQKHRATSLECLAPVVPVVIPTSFSIAEGCEKGLGVTRDPACEVVVLEII